MINSVGGLGCTPYGYGLTSGTLEARRQREFKPCFGNANASYAKYQAEQRNTNVLLGTLATVGAIGAAVIFRKPIGKALAKVPELLKTGGKKLLELGKKAIEFVKPLPQKIGQWFGGLFKKA